MCKPGSNLWHGIVKQWDSLVPTTTNYVFATLKKYHQNMNKCCIKVCHILSMYIFHIKGFLTTFFHTNNNIYKNVTKDFLISNIFL